MKLTDYLNAINYTKESLMDTEDEFVEKQYPAFVVNRCLSYFVDTVFHANMMNQFPHIDNKLQFDYYTNSIRKKKRFSKWLKKEEDDSLSLIKEYFDYSNEKAEEAKRILSEDDIENIRREMFKGGKA